MPPRQDHISIKRVPPKDRPSVEPEETSSASTERQRPAKQDKDIIRRYRIAALLIGLLGVMLLIALLSYTDHDADNAQLSLRDLMGVVRGDEAMRVRFDTTHNWLGLLGAVISHWMFHSTVGRWSILFPVLMIFWARDLFRHQRVTPLMSRRSVVATITVVLVAGIVGTMQLISWMPTIDLTWSGAIGQFLAGVLSQFIGTAGSMLVLLAATGFVVVLGFNVNVTRLGIAAKLGLARVKDVMERRRASVASEPTETPADGPAPMPTPDDDGIAVAPTDPSVDRDEPAEMLRPHTIPQPISPHVRIVRPIPKPPAEEPPAAPSAKVDLDVVQQRLSALHPGKKIDIKPPMDPAEHGPHEDTPLFTSASEHERDEPTTPPEPIAAPLTVLVEEKMPEEAVRDVGGAVLYDEQIVYKEPTIDLLVESKDDADVDDAELRNNARLLQEKLETFRIKIENLTVQPGPVVTQYEFVPAAGIKVSQIESLADDIALALKAQGVRIIAPIPGRGTVGIEIPNHKPAVVRFSSIIKSPKYHNPDIRLPIAMGKTVVGEVYCADLAKMPHLLIAGATGKGKSVGINTIIASLLFKMHPRDLKFVIVDPKRVEMTLYKALKNHFLAVSPDVNETIITEPANAVMVLKSVVEEMQQRYSVLAAAGQRNIADYNRKAAEGSLREKSGMVHRPMPYIVVIIDELADLMMTASKEVEEPIVRLAQLARAVGIHCVVATQRPSVDVVTGLIKANFPARIAYQVASRIDSRTILDASGAEHLIGNGDMLFNPGNMTKPIRMQNAFISTEEVEALCEHIGHQKGYSTPYTLPSVAQKRGASGGGGGDDRDVLFEEAARIFIALQQASVSTLQRRLKIGYARAARIVDELEMAGIVGPPDGSKGRQVLLMSEAELEAYL